MPSIEVERREGRGRCLIAAKDFGLGDLVSGPPPAFSPWASDSLQKAFAALDTAVYRQCLASRVVWYVVVNEAPKLRAHTCRKLASEPSLSLMLVVAPTLSSLHVLRRLWWCLYSGVSKLQRRIGVTHHARIQCPVAVLVRGGLDGS